MVRCETPDATAEYEFIAGDAVSIRHHREHRRPENIAPPPRLGRERPHKIDGPQPEIGDAAADGRLQPQRQVSCAQLDHDASLRLLLGSYREIVELCPV